jgi:hypothetical protein
MHWFRNQGICLAVVSGLGDGVARKPLEDPRSSWSRTFPYFVQIWKLPLWPQGRPSLAPTWRARLRWRRAIKDDGGKKRAFYNDE